MNEEIPEAVIQDAISEGTAIWESHYTTKSSLSGMRTRDKHDIIRDCLLGKIGEYFLIRDFGYTNDQQKWHDLIDGDGVSTEVKTLRTEYFRESNVQGELSRLRSKVREGWFYSKKLVVILYENDVLTIHGIYDI